MSRLEEEMQKSRVVVTGMGAITPIGLTVEEFWENVKAQKVGIGAITKFDTTDFKVKLAAEVKGFDAQAYMDFKQAKRMELFSQYAVAAAGQAIKDAGLDMEKEDAYRVGTSIGSGIGSLDAMEREHKKLLERGPGRINPLLVPLMITNMAAGNVSIAYGLKGKNINVVTACATGTNSIGEAYRSIQCGDADVMVCGGTESSITPIGIGGFTALTALSTSTDPLGIPTAIFEGTLHHISEEGMRRFNRRMCGDKETFNRYSELSPRPLEEIKEELESLYNQILPEKLESADPRISTFWDQAILSTEDKIFPATNLRNYWQGRCPIQEIKAPHLPFYHYQSWNELWK